MKLKNLFSGSSSSNHTRFSEEPRSHKDKGKRNSRKGARSRFYLEEDSHPSTCGSSSVKVGNRIVWLRESPPRIEHGLVRWVGVIENEEIAGIEFDHQLGLGSGWYRNHRLFPCRENHGGLVAVAGLMLEEDYNFESNSFQSSDEPRAGTSASASSVSSGSVDISMKNTDDSLSLGFKNANSNRATNTVVALEADAKYEDLDKIGHPDILQASRVTPLPPYSRNYSNIQDVESGDLIQLTGPPRFFQDHFSVTPLQIPTGSATYRGSPDSGFVTPPNNSPDQVDKLDTTQLTMPFPLVHEPLKEEDVERINGRQKGIQGHRNSCYLDATLFSMFSFTSVFDSILIRDVKDPSESEVGLAKEVQRILREEIVTPLRKELYCSANNIMKLREIMQHLDDKLTAEEMDPQEFLELLFSKALNLKEFMSLSSGHSDFFHQVLAHSRDNDASEREGRSPLPTVQALFENSLLMQDLKLNCVPKPALILQMPRSGNKYKMYDGIFPNLTIDITDLIQNTPRQCTICGSLATYECSKCYGGFNNGKAYHDEQRGGAEATSFCESCLRTSHQHRDRVDHNSFTQIKYAFDAHRYFPSPNNSINVAFNRNPGIPPSQQMKRAIPRVTMDLFAIICIETSHFVSFVKCGTERTSPWVFFDSMADRIENMNGTGQNIPQVKHLPSMGLWLDKLERDPQSIRKQMDSFGPDLKRLLSDPYICLYYSPECSMYA